jgi:hypothetical protein
MLLETLDIKENDIIIYSKNIFNEENNFRIIYKDDPSNIPKKILFRDVCKFIQENSAKNIILYRLLINIDEIEIGDTKYGIFLYVHGERELFYTDPIYAVKELEEYLTDPEKETIRFRIQQVGLTSVGRVNNYPNYSEVYSVDLEAKEAKFQNDKMFAEAIFVRGNKKHRTKEDHSITNPTPDLLEEDFLSKNDPEEIVNKKIIQNRVVTGDKKNIVVDMQPSSTFSRLFKQTNFTEKGGDDKKRVILKIKKNS